MPLQELVNFRAKYPDYNDLPDTELAGMLAKKFPDAYGDLPTKVTGNDSRVAENSLAVDPMNATPAEKAKTAAAQRKFLAKEGSLGTQLRNTPVSEYIKEPIRFASEAATMTANAGLRGLKSVASTVQAGGEGIRTGSVDAALRKYAEKQAEFQPVENPMYPSWAGEQISGLAGKGIQGLSNLTGRPDIVEPVAQGAMDIAALAGLRGAARAVGPELSRAVKSGVEATRPTPTELQALSAEHNVPLTAGEALSSPNMKQVEARLERLPVLGIRGFRKGQGEALAQSAKNIADEFATASEDPATTLVDRFKSNLKRGKEAANEAYAKVGEELAANGDPGAIEPVATRGQLKTLLAQSPDIFERLPGSQNRLKSIMAEIAGDTAPKKVGIEVAPEFGTIRKHGEAPQMLLGPDGKPIAKQVNPKLSYDDYTWLRSQLGEYIDRAHSSAGAVGSNELRQLTIIKKSLDTDFYRWGKDSGYENVTAAVDNARNVYKTKVAPFENVPILKSIVNDKFTPEQLLDQIAKPGQATLATRAMKGLTEGDKALVQDAIMRRGLALGFEGAKEGAPISGAKFATFFEKMDTKTKNAAQSPMDVFFNPADKQRVMGFAKLARAAERSGQYAANPLTGIAAADFAIPGAIGTVAGTIGGPAAATAAAFTKVMSLMLTTNTGKALLQRAYRLPKGATKAWDSLLNDVGRLTNGRPGSTTSPSQGIPGQAGDMAGVDSAGANGNKLSTGEVSAPVTAADKAKIAAAVANARKDNKNLKVNR